MKQKNIESKQTSEEQNDAKHSRGPAMWLLILNRTHTVRVAVLVSADDTKMAPRTAASVFLVCLVCATIHHNKFLAGESLLGHKTHFRFLMDTHRGSSEEW